MITVNAEEARDRGKAVPIGTETRLPAVVACTIAYERWLSDRVDVIEPDLRLKHEDMAQSLFAFLRATFYRWVPLWLDVCRGLAEAPRVLAVGDLHVENFGTWRDTEGRLVWGVNDFDEVARMPYAIDLVRLVTSASVAQQENGLAIELDDAANAVLDGYSESLRAGGRPFILEESHPDLRSMALAAEREPVHFWSKLRTLAKVKPPKHVRRILERSLPDGFGKIAFSSRIAGIGSLGRPRYVAIAYHNGGLVAREAKAWVPSSWGWAEGQPKERTNSIRLLKRAVRQPDPSYVVKNGWVVRRLGPYCGRIELTALPRQRDERRILRAMGYETANLHLAVPSQRAAVLRDLAGRRPDWLVEAAHAMSRATEQDWKSFRSSV